MEAFWKWLMRANARGVLAGALLVLLLVMGWWGWREFHGPSVEKPLKPHRQPRAGSQGLGLLAYLDQQLAAGEAMAVKDPFAGARRPARPSPPSTNVVVVVTHPPKAVEPVTPVAAVPMPAPPVAAPKAPETFELQYLGVMTRPDGRIMALVRDSKAGTTAFYAPGSVVRGVRLGRLTADAASVIGADGTIRVVKVGESATFTVAEDHVGTDGGKN